MRAYLIETNEGIDAIRQVERPDPTCGAGQIKVRIKAASLNFRDLIVAGGGYHRNDRVPVVPLSDAAGEVVEVGADVKQFAVGDRVAGCFFQDWEAGEVTDEQMFSALGGGLDGVLAEFACFNERGAVHIPDGLSFEEAATLPCAAVTTWQALVSLGNVQPGQTILCLGTGGVSIFGLQFAKAAGARVIITSSSDEKLAKATELGADQTINYKSIPEWHREVRRLTDGVGVDNVLEVGGPGTLERSLKSVRVSGRVSLIGVLTGVQGQVNPLLTVFNRLTLQGIYVGSREMFLAMNRGLEASDIHPVIDRTFPFDEALDAYRYLQSGSHFGKVVITVS